MRNYLMHEELWEAISGYPTGMNVSNVTKIRSDQKALTKICLTLESSAITHVRSATTAAEAWNALQNAYEDKGMGRRLYLERKLYRLRLEDFDNNIESYINAVISTAQDLADIGKVIDDASIAAILLGGLTSRYDPMIMALENSNVQVTIEIVKSKTLQKSRDVTFFEDCFSSLNNRNVNNTKTSTEPLVLSNSLPIQEETSTVEESFESAPGPTVESAPSHTVVAENQTAENDQFFEAIEEPIVSTGQTDGQRRTIQKK
ncbi:hypothetical protein HF086_010880 [Spodoptera exigua]|uniref:Retrovirus-related Pol polyprotein from transposon TNT 1-94 n=1 Tax=Spodoptera exigua TaxID=7107 RepID=A0A922MB23_SPOEX|nr:hypothetical protein HF086_010880 [Spodoptera exigua]